MIFGRSFNKFKNAKVYENGVKVADSKAENRQRLLFSKHFNLPIKKDRIELIPKHRVGTIAIRACHYEPDFTIVHNGQTYYIDAKGMLTPEFKIKDKLMIARGTPILLAKNLKQAQAIIDGIKAGKSPVELFAIGR